VESGQQQPPTLRELLTPVAEASVASTLRVSLGSSRVAKRVRIQLVEKPRPGLKRSLAERSPFERAPFKRWRGWPP